MADMSGGDGVRRESILRPAPGATGKLVTWAPVVREFSRHQQQTVHNVSDCVRYLEEGIWMVKLRGSTDIARLVKYDTEHKFIWWTSKAKTIRSIPVASITKVARGKQAKAFQLKKYHDIDPLLCVSIFHGKEELPLVAETHAACHLFVVGLRHLAAAAQGKADPFAPIMQGWLKNLFGAEDKSGSGILGKAEVLRIFELLLPGPELHGIDRTLQNLYELRHGPSPDPDFTLQISFDEFEAIVHRLCVRQEVVYLLDQYACMGSSCVTAPELLRFVRCEQQDFSATERTCASLIEKYEPSPHARTAKLLGPIGFARLIEGEFSGAGGKAEEDWSKPLHHYYWLASHNTFLAKDQLKGPSEPEAFDRALTRGCRFVEVDVWDGEDGEPTVYNGYTATGKIALAAALQAIAANAFTSSPHPLVVFLENHCTPGQQLKVVALLQDILGPHLHIPTAEERAGPLPSPAALQHKILLLSKRIKDEVTADCAEVSEDDEAEPHDARRKRRNRSKANVMEDETPRAPYNLTKALSDLVALSSHRLDESGRTPTNKWSVLSIDDNKALRLFENNPTAFAMLAAELLVRVYPSALRVNSDNYESRLAWLHGTQLMSMNTQTADLPLRTHLGLFPSPGGLSLKPRTLRRPCWILNPTTPSIAPRAAKLYTIQVISAVHLPPAESARRNVVDPFVTLAIDGLVRDTKKEATPSIENNSVDPYFTETLQFPVACESLAVFSAIVCDDSRAGDNFIGQFSCPCSHLRTGYRHLPLYGRDGTIIPRAAVFVKIEITTSHDVPDLPPPTDAAQLEAVPKIPGELGDQLSRLATTLKESDQEHAANVLALTKGAPNVNVYGAAAQVLAGVRGKGVTVTAIPQGEGIGLHVAAEVDTVAAQFDALKAVLDSARKSLFRCIDCENELDEVAPQAAALQDEKTKEALVPVVAQVYRLLDGVRSIAVDDTLGVKMALAREWRYGLDL